MDTLPAAPRDVVAVLPNHLGDLAMATPALRALRHGFPAARVRGVVRAGLEAIYLAMMLGLHDYVEKNGFPGVILGLSGGIDSALTAAVAVDALGADRVHSVMMPSPYTSTESLEDAAECAALLGGRLDEIVIGSFC